MIEKLKKFLGVEPLPDPIPQAIWGGGHSFIIYDIDDIDKTNWNSFPGVYIFANVNSMKTWQALYIGSTSLFFKFPPSSDPIWDKAITAGATHVHAKTVSNKSDRINLVDRLINAYTPPLNSKENNG